MQLLEVQLKLLACPPPFMLVFLLKHYESANVPHQLLQFSIYYSFMPEKNYEKCVSFSFWWKLFTCSRLAYEEG